MSLPQFSSAPTPKATSTKAGKIKLTGDLSGTADNPTVPGLVQAQISTLTVVGHSFTAASDSGAYGDPNYGYTGMIARLNGLMGIHENNLTHLGTGASYLTRTASAFGAPNCGWGGVFQFINPYTSPLQGDYATNSGPQYSTPVPSSFLLVHHINDQAIGGIGTTQNVYNNYVLPSYKTALRAVLSRFRAGSLYSSYYPSGSGASVTWDSALTFSGTSTLGSTTVNTGVAYANTSGSGSTFTFTIPASFTGGTIAMCFLSSGNGWCINGTNMNLTDSSTIITVSGNTADFANGDVIKMSGSNELMRISSGGGTTSLTVSRGFNGTTKTTHAINDDINIDNYALVNFSGTASSATGTLSVGAVGNIGYGGGKVGVPVVNRFVCTAADAGKTIIATSAQGYTTAGVTFPVNFDSVWIESNDPQPVVMSDVCPYGFGSGYAFLSYANMQSFNTAIASVAAEFDGAIQIANTFTPVSNRGGTLNSSITNVSGTGGTTFVITANNATTFAALPQNSTFCIEGERLRAATITNNNDGTFTLGNVTRGVDGTTAASHALGKIIAESSWFSNDGIHPSTYGSTMYATAFYNAFQNCLETTSYTLAQAGGSSSLDYRANNLGLTNLSYLTLPTNVQTNAAGVANTMYAHPIYIPQVCIINAIGSVVTTLNASSTLRFALYGLDSARSRPQYLIHDFGTVGGTATGFRSVSANKIVRPGWYYLAVADQGTASTKRCIGVAGLNLPYLATTSAPATGYNPLLGFSQTGVTGAFPSLWSSYTEVTTAVCPIIFIQIRSKHMG